MTLPTLFEICSPRPDVRDGRIAESDFAADLAQVLRGDAPLEYRDPIKFFANTHPTMGLKELLKSVCLRLQGSSDQLASIFRLDTNYGGGKTHSLIALTHVVNGMQGVQNTSEFIDPGLVPTGRVRIAAFDGENADPVNGRLVGNEIRAKTPWGELAYGLAGCKGYELIQASDEQGVAPGAETIRELFGNEPTLILLDELSVYLRKLKAKERDRAGGQITAFLTGLFKAVESSPQAALVFTLAIGKSGLATDAYSEENQFIAAKMDELASISARKATVLDPTKEDETVKVLRRRLFDVIDDAQAEVVIREYQRLWSQHREAIASTTSADQRLEAFRNGYPLHPELIETLRDKTSTLSNFQRVRGMLRLLARAIAQLWKEQPQSTYAIHLHHLDPGNENIRREILTKLGLNQYLPAIRSDVAGVEGDQPSLAQELDEAHYKGLLPYASYAARGILFHSFAFNESLKGLTAEQLRYSSLAPGTDLSFIDDAVRRFVQNSAYLDDRPNVPLRFLADANLTQLIRRYEQLVDPAEIRAQLNDRICTIFKGNTFQYVFFPGGPYDIPDDAGDGKPYLVIIGYEAEVVRGSQVQVPALVQRLYKEKGSSSDLRLNRNNLVFLCVDGDRVDHLRNQMRRRLSLRNIKRPEELSQLPAHQQEKLKELDQRSEFEITNAIQQAYRYLFYPSRARLEGSDVDLAYAALEDPSTSEAPGKGQKQVTSKLQEVKKLRLPEDMPDAPSYIRDKTPLRRGQITTASLRLEFYRDPGLPMLVGDQVFIRGIVQGIESGEFVYRSGDLIWGKGQPGATIKLDENSYVYTAEYAHDNDIWPPKTPVIPQPSQSPVSEASPLPGISELGGGTSPTPRTDTGGVTPPITPSAPGAFVAEGLLREALNLVWEQARSAQVKAIALLEVQIFDASDAFTLIAVIRAIPKAKVDVNFSGEYETKAGSMFSFEFNGQVEDALPVKDFLASQLRAAISKNLHATYSVNFTEALDLSGDDPEKLTERFSRLGAGAAHVSAKAEGAT